MNNDLSGNLIAPEEMVHIFKHSIMGKLINVPAFQRAYNQSYPVDSRPEWYQLLFFYHAGKIQGIREERAKKRSVAV